MKTVTHWFTGREFAPVVEVVEAHSGMDSYCRLRLHPSDITLFLSDEQRRILIYQLQMADRPVVIEAPWETCPACAGYGERAGTDDKCITCSGTGKWRRRPVEIDTEEIEENKADDAAAEWDILHPENRCPPRE